MVVVREGWKKEAIYFNDVSELYGDTLNWPISVDIYMAVEYKNTSGTLHDCVTTSQPDVHTNYYYSLFRPNEGILVFK